MTRSGFSVFLLFFTAVTASAQITTVALKPGEEMIIKLSNTAAQQLHNSVNAVEVLDAREDTSSLGYYTPQSARTAKIVFSGKTEEVIAGWMNRYFGMGKTGDAGDKLFGVIRKLRISDEITPKTFGNGHQGQPRNGWDRGVIIKIEYYLRRDSSYYPLYRFDSLLVFDEKLYSYAGEFVAAALDASLQKLYTVNIDSLPSKARKVSFADISGKIKKSADLPVLTAAVYKKGAYASFNEFRNNDPSVIAYEFKEGKLGDLLYVKKEGLEYPVRNVWGFCDGKDIYINSGDKFSQLIRTGNTFDFKGIKSITRNVSLDPWKASVFNLVTNTGEKVTKFHARLKYYQVDMETGDVY